MRTILPWTLILVMFILTLVAFTATAAFGQQQDTMRSRHCLCPCDSAFMRRVAYRIERSSETSDRIFSRLRDYEEAQTVLEKQLDSLRAFVRTFSEKQRKTLKSKQ